MKIEIQATLEKDDGYRLTDVESMVFDFLNKEFYLTSERNNEKSYKQIYHNRKRKIKQREPWEDM